MKTSNNVTMTIVIKAKNDIIAREYVSPLNRQTYIEGRENSAFAIRLTNNNRHRVLAVLSVDGLSIMDGKPAGQDSSGYVLDAGQVLDVPGWIVDGATAAQFFFSGITPDGQDNSYAAQSGGETANKGVIGLMVFNEDVRVAYRTPNNTSAMRGMFRKGISGGGLYASNAATMLGSYTSSVSDATTSQWDAATPSFNSSVDLTNDAALRQTLGTGFGEATDFNTTEVTFKRGQSFVSVLYYDDARGLKRVGIDVARPTPALPSAFPADNKGCTPPSGWTK